MPSTSAIKRVSYAFLLSCLLALLTAPSEASALSNVGAQLRHVHHPQRMVKVRQPRAILNGGNAENAAATGNDGTGTDTGTDTGDTGTGAGGSQNQNTASSSTTSAAQSQTSATSTTAASTTSNGGALDSILNGGSTTSSSSTTSAVTESTTSSTTSAATTSAAQSTTAAQSSFTSSTAQTSSATTSVGPSTIAISSTVNVTPTATSDSDNSDSTANTIGKKTIIAIAVIASCVGGAAAIWTLIRKWKLGTSARFDNRLNPIEWSPEMDGQGSGLPGGVREKDAMSSVGGEKHRRTGSAGSHGSFHSSDIDHNGLGRNVTGNGNMFADQNPSTMPPAHDFTAGPAVGYSNAGAYDYSAGTGYVDLQRSNSGSAPAAGAAAGADLTRGPSLGHSAAYGTGHEYAAYAQHDAYAQDAYGGYEAYAAPHNTYGATADPYAQQQYGANQYSRGQY